MKQFRHGASNVGCPIRSPNISLTSSAIDSTVTQLHDELQPHFKGQRGSQSEMKIGLAVSVFGLLPLLARLVCRCVHDSHLFSELTTLRPGTLILADNAFVSAASLRNAAQRRLLFVCPMRRNGHAQIVAIHRAPKRVRRALESHPEGVELRTLLDKSAKTSKVWDLQVKVTPTVGEDRRPVEMRLVIVPHNKRPRYYLTNLPPKWSAAAVAELYRLRWQIELVFKELKQDLALRSIPTKLPKAAQIFVWASLIALVISRTVVSRLTPLRHLTGLKARHCVAVVTRALRSFVGILGAILTAQQRHSHLQLLNAVSSSSSRPHKPRLDSFQALEALLPAASA